TGGAIRLGRAIALGLADAGFDVVIGYHRSRADARATVRALKARGAHAVALRADLRDAAAAHRLVAGAARALGGLDALVNSAAGPVLKPERRPRARWRAITRGRAGRPADVVRAVVRYATCAPSLTGRVATIAGGRSGTTARRRRAGR